MTNPNDSRLEALQRYADGTGTSEDVAAVERAILDDSEFRQLAIEYLYLDGAMEEFGARTETELVVKPVFRMRWALAAAAAVAAIVTGLALWQGRPAKTPPVQGGVAVEILDLVEARVAAPHDGMRIHDNVQLDALELRGGEAHLRLSSEVKLVVSGPAALRFIDPMHAQIMHGKVTVDGGPHGKGFILDTPVTSVVDVGTQFGVEARADGFTDVLVIKGKVELHDPQQAQRAAPLEEGEAVRVNASQAIARIVNITVGPKPGEWSTQPPPDDCSIASVSDNFGAAEGYHFYRIAPRGLRSGAVAYTNRTHVWKAADGQDFPASLTDADVVQTFFGELKRPGYAIDIVLARPVDLFVLMPRRGIPQPWLAEHFTRTGEEIVMEENGIPPRPPSRIPFEVWKLTMPHGGRITLGPGNRDARGGPVGMYGIAAKALSPAKAPHP